MPFSRSRSPESMTRSATTWLARKAPVWRSIASTSVVLPWSTWATMATLRMSARTAGVAGAGGGGGGGMWGGGGCAGGGGRGGGGGGGAAVAACGALPSGHAHPQRPEMTVAAVILSATPEGALRAIDGRPLVRRLAEAAWSGGGGPGGG